MKWNLTHELNQVNQSTKNDQTVTIQKVKAEPKAFLQEYSWSAVVSNMNDGDKPIITRSVRSIDGYERLELSYFNQDATTIDLVSGSHSSDLNPPLFKDDSLVDNLIQQMTPQTNILMLDPNNPERVPYFKVVGDESMNLTSRLNITVTDNDDKFKTSFKFDKINTNVEDNFKLMVCYNFENYDNLQELCDEETHHSVNNALGYCFLDFMT